jgi:hypothetical protein
MRFAIGDVIGPPQSRRQKWRIARIWSLHARPLVDLAASLGKAVAKATMRVPRAARNVRGLLAAFATGFCSQASREDS